MESVLLMFLMIFMSGKGGNDLLDYLPTDAYWKAKAVAPTVETMLAELKPPKADAAKDLPALMKDLGAEDFAVREAATAKIRAMGPGIIPQLKAAAEGTADPEARSRVALLVGELSGAAKAREVRRLMAIRTLGDLKKPEALADLKGLLASREPFVADYAQAAIAAIEGQPYTRPVPGAEDLASDAWLMPKNVGAVGQFSMPPGGPINVEDALKQAAGMPGMRDELGDPEKVKAQLAKAVMNLSERIGNVRIQAVTFGVAEEVGDRVGFVMIVARGIYDPAAVKVALGQVGGRPGSAGGVDVVTFPEPSATLALSSERRLAFLVGPDEKSTAQPVKAMLAALKAGKGTLSENQELAALVKTMKPGDPLWAAARVTDCYSQAPLLAGCDAVTLVGRNAGGGTDLNLVAKGRDDEKLKAAAAMFEKGRDEAAKEIKREAERMPFLKPFADFVAGIKVEAKPGEVNVRGRMEGQVSPAVMMAFPWLMMGAAMEK